MFRPRTSARRDRRGMILLIVITLLTLFAVIGLAFVMFAENQANSQRIWREARGTADLGPDPFQVFNQFMSNLVYDVPDDKDGAQSAIRGHSLARGLYGWNSQFPSTNQLANTVPYNGFGRPHGIPAPPVYGGPDDYPLVNYKWFQADGFVRDPEWTQWRAAPSAPGAPFNHAGTFIAKNAPYTYPDENNMFLAVADPRTGRIIAPSFHRDWLLNPANPSNAWDLANPNLTNAFGKYLTLRPRPQAPENPNFPYPRVNPADPLFGPQSYGDVENLEGKVKLDGTPAKQYDSFWIDFGYPTRSWRGKTYRPLAAVLVLDLDGRLNVNVAGNLRANGGHASNQGWGTWEMSLQRLMALNNPADSVGMGQAATLLQGRYGALDKAPSKLPVFNTSVPLPPPSPVGVFDPSPNRNYPTPIPTNQAASGTGAHDYSNVDYDASFFTQGGGAPAVSYRLTGLNSFPSYPQRYDNGSMAERTDHPMLFNPFLLKDSQLTPILANIDDTIYGLDDIFLLNFKFSTDTANYQRAKLVANSGGTTGPNASRLYTDVGGAQANRRFLLTNLSTDFDRLGIQPWAYNSGTAAQVYQQAAPPGPGQVSPPPAADPIFPSLNGLTNPNPSVPPTYATGSNNSEFSATGQAITAGARDLQSQILYGLGAIDLNRNLYSYNSPGTNTFDPARFAQATAERQRFAQDIFFRLAAATGAWIDPKAWADPDNVNILGTFVGGNINDPRYIALRWLAQLAVNIVDYIDDDEIMTPFQWDPKGNANEILYGTELPRLVINESYVEYDNDPADPTLTTMKKASYYRVKCWLELLNPLGPVSPSSFMSPQGAPGAAEIITNGNSAYRVLIGKANSQSMRDITNTTGNPTDLVNANKLVQIDLGSIANIPQMVKPNNGAYTGDPNSGFLVLGPEKIPGPNGPTPSAQSAQFYYDVKQTEVGPNDVPIPPSFYLQRLACPYMAAGGTNQYVTVDYVQYTLPTQVNNGLDQFDFNGGQATPTPPNDRHSWGRVQPYAGMYDQSPPVITNPLQKRLRAADVTGLGGQDVNQTFLRHNGQSPTQPGGNGDQTLQMPFEWLCHLDRALISPIELFQVSAWKPHELTQQFVSVPRGVPPGLARPQSFQHLAVWASPQPPTGVPPPQQTYPDRTRLFRALAYLRVRDRTLGMGFNTRRPGLININTVWDENPIQAIADGDDTTNSSGNHFRTTDISNMWAGLLNYRSPGTIPGPPVTYQVGQGDRPILPPSAPICTDADPQYQNVTAFPGPPAFPYTGGRSGIARTVMNGVFNVPDRNTPSTPSVQDPPRPQHPYEQYELLNKIFNNITTKSNVFAVWVTFGYFEVLPNGTLGLELGTTAANLDSWYQRDKFFAIVDRTNIAIDPSQQTKQGPKPILLSYEPKNDPSPGSDDHNPANNQTFPQTFPQTITLKVPAMVVQTDTANQVSSLVGYYEGERWIILSEFQPNAFNGTQLRIDVGGQEEVVQVGKAGVVPVANGGDGVPFITVRCNKPHARGAPMMINNTILGNPGPQPNFDYAVAPYSSVVRYVTYTTLFPKN
jgi:hypothetical protein